MTARSTMAETSPPHDSRSIRHSHPSPAAHTTGRVALNRSAGFTFVTMLTGQWLFFSYIAVFYGISTLQGNFQHWNRNTMLFKGYVAGDRAGNALFAIHVLLAGVIAIAGCLQLVPALRRRFPSVHRWNGRVFLATAMLVSVAGLYLTWTRRSASPAGQVAITIDALLIIIFGAVAIRTARARQLTAHRRWALRAFVATSGVWFARIGFMAWVVVNRGPVAMRTFNQIWQFGCYLLPLFILELYLVADGGTRPREKRMMAAGLAFVSVLMIAGIFGMFAFIWRPLMGGVSVGMGS